MTSDFHRTALLLGIAGSAMAAEVSLQGNGRLSGEVKSMDADGMIELVSPLSEKPLRIRADKTTRVDFGTSQGDFQVSGQTVQLRNGDMLPIRVNSMADGLLEAESQDIGRISIPREMISTVQLGIFPQRVIYSGPEDFKGWIRDKSNPESWTIDGGEFVAEGQGTVSMDAGLPEKFIIKFSFTWNGYPNLQFGFGEPQDAGSGRVDRYLLQFAGSGIGIFRESAAKNGNVPIVFLNRASDRLRDNRMEVEIRVDRSRGRLQLYVDGELEGRYTDPVPGIPAGTGISITSKAPQESTQRIGDIKLLEWDDRGDRHRTEERGDGQPDSLISRYGDRLGGTLTGIRRDGGGSVYLFKNDFQKETLELPEDEVSTVFFGVAGASPKDPLSDGFTLSLRGGGRMTVSSCVFGSGKVNAKHPLLGDVEISRDGITSLARRVVPKAKPANDR